MSQNLTLLKSGARLVLRGYFKLGIWGGYGILFFILFAGYVAPFK